ncbi:flagellar hook-basal body complex protein FliE [Pandoraea communis]|uniref:Flagellar hook-basal body complex protein FliE n=1 Tax=Pandoraea communis TaxID=2508297 RepID=A0A5E4X613_9BURK|nr:flagellar hook-basal body complex protein FliE [Pandoraea communis]MDM8358225.1 flagellar hook-basal body complex protein FliE [Pandoraea communis]VVE31565.1 flagellar hook-basal body complex protein FliE [Pandoraea communis]
MPVSMEQSLMTEMRRMQAAQRELDMAAGVREAAPALAGASGKPDFGAMLRGVDAAQRDAGDRMKAVDLGHSDDLTGAMLASAQADLSFSMLMRTRDKVVGAVEELVRMPF